MISSADPEMLEEIRDRSVEEILFRCLGVFEQITGDEGQMYGDVKLTGAEARAVVTDLAGRGVLAQLQFIDDTVGSRHTDKLLREFDRAMNGTL